MCRITGFWDLNYKGEYELEKTIEGMNQTQKHGGPDEQGVFFDEKRGLALGNCRLSILDLSPLGHQPMFSDDKNIALVFNGEIYNFSEVKKELEIKGYSFKSNSDTEVIIKAYQEWEISCLEKFRGMFAFALFDRNKEKLFLVRDRIGVKPLYYCLNDGFLSFSSEIRALIEHPKFKKELSQEGLSLYLQFGYIPYPYSIFKNVFKIPPGSFLTFSKNGKINIEKYWDLSEFYLKSRTENKDLSREEALLKLENILVDSFKLRLVSDVPVGVFLSGGIDSSIVATLLQKDLKEPLRTFTIGFEDKEYNEASFAKEISSFLKTEHTEIYCTQKDALEIVPQLPEIYDEPFGDSSAVPTFLISKLARKEVKVALSGDGGDEIFAGYDKYWKIAGNPLFKTAGFLKEPKAFSDFLVKKNYKAGKLLKAFCEKDIFERFIKISTGFFPKEISTLLRGQKDMCQIVIPESQEKNRIEKLDDVSKWMIFDAKYYLPEDILTKVDRASMHNALEAREPLLDNKIIEFVAGLPSEFKHNIKGGKYLLKSILGKYLPDKYWDRPKHGFSIPMRKWLLKELKPLCDEFLGEKCINEAGILDYRQVSKFRKSFSENKNSNPYRIWYLLVFQMWTYKWL